MILWLLKHVPKAQWLDPLPIEAQVRLLPLLIKHAVLRTSVNRQKVTTPTAQAIKTLVAASPKSARPTRRATPPMH